MALSGSFNGTTNNDFINCKIEWSATQSISGNYSDVTANLYYWRTNSGYTTSGTINGKITINGVSTSYSKRVSLTYNSNTLAATITTRVYHNNDGTKLCDISATGAIDGASLNKTNLSSSVTLTTIPRASSIDSVSNGTLPYSPTIKWTPKASTMQFQVKIVCGNYDTGYTSNISPGRTSQYTYSALSLAKTVAQNFTTSATGQASVYLRTLDASGKIIGTASKTFTVTAPTDAYPSISSVTITEAVTGLKSKFGVYVQNKSKLSVTVNAAGTYNASIASIKTTCQGVTYTSKSFTTGVLTSSGTDAITLKTTVTDSRGRSSSVTNKVSVTAYIPPQITSASASRANTSGVIDEDGTKLQLAANWNISSVGSKNDHTYTIKYKAAGAASFTTLQTGSANYSYNSTMNFIKDTEPTFTTDKSYIIRLEISDYFTSDNPVWVELALPTAFTLLDFRSTGKGFAIGKVSEKDKLECNLEAEFLKAVTTPNLYDLRRGIALKSGDDLDTYKDVGVYYSQNSDLTATLQNCPHSGSNFKLIVEQLGASSYKKQTLIAYVRMYVRYWDGSAWSDWRSYIDTGSGVEYPFSSSQTVGILKDIAGNHNIYPMPGVVDINDLGVDLNNLQYSGFYYWRGTVPTHAPTSATWRFLLNIRYGERGVQLCMSYISSNIQYRYNDGEKWYGWKALSFS